MSKETKVKLMSANELQKAVKQNARDISSMQNTLTELMQDSPDYSGGLKVTVNNLEHVENFFMVTMLEYDDMFLQFYHLSSLKENDPLSLERFPERKSKQKLVNYVKDLYKSKNWNIVYYQTSLGSVNSISTIGHFTYTDKMRVREHPPIIKKATSNISLIKS